MREFKQQDYENLKPFEAHLNRGYYGRYYYGLRRADFNKLVEIYRDLGLTQAMDYSCGRCILQLTCTLGKAYFEYKKKMEEDFTEEELEKMGDEINKAIIQDMGKNPEPPKNTSKRKVGEYNTDGELIREFESVTKAVEETGVSKGNIYKSLKESVVIDGKIFKYIE
jgi:hypothetical protein